VTEAGIGPLGVQTSGRRPEALRLRRGHESKLWRAESGSDPVAGMRLGRYRLIEPLGRGSQGQVWRAFQVEPVVEEVALKLLTPEQASTPGYRSRFHCEAQWGARLAHPSLLPTYEFGTCSGYLFLTMPLVAGDSLASVIARRRQIEPGSPGPEPGPARRSHWLDRLPRETYVQAIMAMGARVARAAAVAHVGRVVHRDIKPANILLDREWPGGVYLCDFGLGRDLDDQATPSARGSAGTPLYMAPERLLGRPANEILSDIYSLGVTLAEAVTLVPPLSIPADLPRSQWAEYLAYSTPLRPRDVAPWLPPAVDDLIQRAMSRAPRDRYPSMAAFSLDLERAAALKGAG
jgi:serine/threonine-protein kinase